MLSRRDFLRMSSAGSMILALSAASARAQATGGSDSPPELAAPSRVSAATAAAALPSPRMVPAGSTRMPAGAGMSGRAVDPLARRATAVSRRPADPQRSGDPQAVRKARVAAARKALANLDHRLAIEKPRAAPTIPPPSPGRASGHLVASSAPVEARMNPYATPAYARPATAAPRREPAVMQAGATMVGPSGVMPTAGAQAVRGVGVSRAVIPPPVTRSSYPTYRTPPVPTATLPATLPPGQARQP